MGFQAILEFLQGKAQGFEFGDHLCHRRLHLRGLIRGQGQSGIAKLPDLVIQMGKIDDFPLIQAGMGLFDKIGQFLKAKGYVLCI